MATIATRFLLVLLLLTNVYSGVALAHSTGFTVWAYNTYLWTGLVDHYDRNPLHNPSDPYDYITPQEAQVLQQSPNNYYWESLHIAAGQILNPDVPAAYKGKTWIFGSGGGEIYYTEAFFCDPIDWDGTLFIPNGVSNGGSQGYWYQESGAGYINCQTNYAAQDKLAITAAP